MTGARRIAVYVTLAACACSLALGGLPRDASGAPDGVAPVRVPRGARSDGGGYDPANATSLSLFAETLFLGNRKFLDKDFPGAMELYRRGTALNPRSALAHCLVAEAHLAMGSVSEAEAELRLAQETGTDRPERARALYLMADVLERQRKREEARDAWTQYVALARAIEADAGEGATLAATAAARIEAIDKALALDEAYAKVRERIAAERAAKADAGSKKK